MEISFVGTSRIRQSAVRLLSELQHWPMNRWQIVRILWSGVGRIRRKVAKATRQRTPWLRLGKFSVSDAAKRQYRLLAD